MTPTGRVEGIFIEHGDGEFLTYPSDQFRIENGDFVILPQIKLKATTLCQEIPLIWRKEQALEELLEKKRIPPEMVDDLHKSFEGALNQLKADARNTADDITRQITKCTKQIQEFHSALINLEIEREIGRINDVSYQKALGIIQWGLKGINAEKNDLVTLKNKLSNMLLGEKTVKKPETPTQKENEKVDASPSLPEPPVVIHVKSPNLSSQ